jgi:nucleotide-binding universal stress UspA family protein
MSILVGYDGSNVSKEALKLAQKHAKAFGAKIVVVTTITRVDPLEYHDIQKAEQNLETGTKEILDGRSSPYEQHVLIGPGLAGEQLIEYAERRNTEEIILGVKKKSRVGKLVFGSTAQHVILNAPCPGVAVK